MSNHGLVFEIQRAAQQAVAADVAPLRSATRLNRTVGPLGSPTVFSTHKCQGDKTMALNHKLDESRYLIDAYVEARDRWNAYTRSELLSGDEMPHLQRVAETLCESHTRLLDDDNFWAAIIDLPRDLENNRREVEQTLDDLYEFLLQEEIILRSLMGANKAKWLITDITSAIDTLREWPTDSSIRKLRHRAEIMQHATCEAHQQLLAPPTKPELGSSMRYRFYRGLKIVGKALLFTAGGVLVVADLTAAGITLPVSLGSVVAGISAMLKQIPDASEHQE